MAKTDAEKVIQDYIDREFTTIDKRTFKMGDYFNPEDFVVNDKNEAFIKHDALLRVTKQLFRIRRRNVMIDQSPNKSNGYCAAVTVGYVVIPNGKDASFDEEFHWDSCADCSESNAPVNYEQYPTTMAETRASGRCLRNILNIPYCTKEEYGEIVHDISNDNEPIRPAVITMIEKKYIGDYGITLDQIKGLVKREFTNIKDLTSAEGADLVQKLHRNLDKLQKENN